MATVTLKGAASFFHAGVKYEKDVVSLVDDKTAQELAEFPQYFQVKFGEIASPTPTKTDKGGVKVVKKTAPVQSVAQGDEPAVPV